MNNINKQKQGLTTELQQEQVAVIQEPKIEIPILPRGQYVRVVAREYDFSRASSFWSKYGYEEVPSIVVTDEDKRYDDLKYKGIFQHRKLIADVSRLNVLFPNEEAEAISKLLVGDGTNGLRLLGEPKYTNHGLNIYIPIISDKMSRKIEGSDSNNDIVRLGVIIRNSMGSTPGQRLALGTELFTFRDLCENGAVFGHEEIGHMSINHYGKDTEKITNMMRELIFSSVGKIEEIFNYYEGMTQVKVGERLYIANKLGEHIPDRFFPNYIAIDKEKEVTKIGAEGQALESHIKKTYRIENSSKDLTLWNVFNDFTKSLWHDKELAFDKKRKATVNLHKIVIDAIKGK